MIKTPRCPLCDQLPELILDDGHQMFCGNDDCTIFVWDAHRSLDDLLMHVKPISVRFHGDMPELRRDDSA